MNKPQLLEAVNKLPDDIEGTLVATDAEGNSFSILDEISVEYVDAADLEYNHVESILSAEDYLEDSGSDTIPDSFKKVAVLWPF